MFFVQWLFANYYGEVNIQTAFELFSFTKETFDYELFYKLEKIYQTDKDTVQTLVGYQSDIINKCIISMGVCEMLNGTENALAISECLHIADLFCNNSKYINSTLERIKLIIPQNKNIV